MSVAGGWPEKGRLSVLQEFKVESSFVSFLPSHRLHNHLTSTFSEMITPWDRKEDKRVVDSSGNKETSNGQDPEIYRLWQVRWGTRRGERLFTTADRVTSSAFYLLWSFHSRLNSS
jgi:hypothetical protein